MGGYFAKPWREYPAWTNGGMERHYLKKINAFKSCKEKYNILIVGPTGAGKSSFINSVFTALDGEFSNIVNVRSAQCSEYGTTGFDPVRMKKHGILGEVVFIDTKGIGTDTKGITQEELISVCRGEHVGDSSNKDTKHVPHCAVIVLNAKALAYMDTRQSSPMAEELKGIYQKIPTGTAPIVVITQCDKLEEDLSKLYYSKQLSEVVQYVKKLIGVTEDSIVLVVNYHGECAQKPDTLKNMHLLSALYCILRAAKLRKERMSNEIEGEGN